MRPEVFPFAAVPAMERAREALLLLAVEPRLKGAVISGPAGALLARAWRSLLPEKTPFVQVPLGVTEDRLAGGLDLERTLATGRRWIAEGLLGEAHGGVLFVDEIGLLDRHLTFGVLDALNTGMVRIEREGVSGISASRFTLLATGDAGAALRDCVAFHVAATGPLSRDQRVEFLQSVEAFHRRPADFARRHAPATALLREQIARARLRLPEVDLSTGDMRRLSQAALDLGVEGHRADLFAVLAARARAALRGRLRVEDEDLEAAVELVLLPRRAAPAHPPPVRPERGRSPAEGQRVPERFDELVVQAALSRVPSGVLDAAPPHGNRRQEPGRRNGIRGMNFARGRPAGTVPARAGATRIALGATLRAAAPWQALRRQEGGEPAIRVMAGDLRFQRFRRRSGLLVLFAVDASGSMAFHRIHQAKGAVLYLLRQAYLYRDLVSVVSFHGDRAQVVLAPTRSVELARRAIDALAVGGGTPLAAALEAALEVAGRALGRRTLLVLLTDGRANVGRRASLWQELEQVCSAVRAGGIASVVIDTSQRFVRGGEAERLAGLLGGRYIYLPRPDPQAVCETVARVAKAARV